MARGNGVEVRPMIDSHGNQVRGGWFVRVKLPTSERKRKQFSFYGTKAEACKFGEDKIREYEGGLSVDADKVLFSDFAARWLEHKAPSIQPGTISNYKEAINRLIPYIGHLPLTDITAIDLEQVIFPSIRTKTKSGKPLGGSAMKKTYQVLKQILDKAVNYDLLLSNPCDKMDAPTVETKEREALTLEQASVFLASLRDKLATEVSALEAKEVRQFAHGNGFGRSEIKGMSNISNITAVYLGYYCGLRIGEALGLTWGCVNLGAGTVRIEQALKKNEMLGDPKTSRSFRTIAISQKLKEHLAWWKDYQAELLPRLGLVQDSQTFVCCSGIGEKPGYANFHRWFRGFANSCGFPGFQYHQLRHNHSTHLIANGVDIKTAAARIGDSEAVLLKVYAHALPENDIAAAELFESLAE